MSRLVPAISPSITTFVSVVFAAARFDDLAAVQAGVRIFYRAALSSGRPGETHRGGRRALLIIGHFGRIEGSQAPREAARQPRPSPDERCRRKTNGSP